MCVIAYVCACCRNDVTRHGYPIPQAPGHQGRIKVRGGPRLDTVMGPSLVVNPALLGIHYKRLHYVIDIRLPNQLVEPA